MIEEIYPEFHKIWNKLSSRRRNSDVKNAIDSWYNELSIPKEMKETATKLVVELINQFYDNKVNDRIPNVLQDIIMNFVKKIITTSVSIVSSSQSEAPVVEQHSNNEYTKFIVLIGFIGAGLGLILYFLYKKQSQQQSTALTPSAIAPKQVLPRELKKNLVIVINYKKNSELIKKLKNIGITSKEQGESLYLATQFLWLGSELKYDLSGFEQCFNQAETIESSEYDVVLVHIKLTESESGFEPDAINRLPAFKRLHEITKSIRVSERLSSKAYNNSELYKN